MNDSVHLEREVQALERALPGIFNDQPDLAEDIVCFHLANLLRRAPDAEQAAIVQRLQQALEQQRGSAAPGAPCSLALATG